MSKPDAEKAGKHPHFPPQLASCASTPPCHRGRSVTRGGVGPVQARLVLSGPRHDLRLPLRVPCPSSPPTPRPPSSNPHSLLPLLPRGLTATLASSAWDVTPGAPDPHVLLHQPLGSFAEGDGCRVNKPPLREGCFPSSETVDPPPPAGRVEGNPGLGVQLA